jgi:hypothetical protein
MPTDMHLVSRLAWVESQATLTLEKMEKTEKVALELFEAVQCNHGDSVDT